MSKPTPGRRTVAINQDAVGRWEGINQEMLRGKPVSAMAARVHTASIKVC